MNSNKEVQGVRRDVLSQLPKDIDNRDLSHRPILTMDYGPDPEISGWRTMQTSQKGFIRRGVMSNSNDGHSRRQRNNPYSRPLMKSSSNWNRHQNPKKEDLVKEKPAFKYTETADPALWPNDATKPDLQWRLHPFCNASVFPTLFVHRRSVYILGNDRETVDIPLDHPSCSSHHAVLQYRRITIQREGPNKSKFYSQPFLMDLNSKNGTFLNGVKVEANRYYPLHERDILKFGSSSREYIFMLESKGTDAETISTLQREVELIKKISSQTK